MAEMSMNKVIHSAVRRDLGRFTGAVAALRPGDTDRARDLERAWDNFHHELTDHHEGEHEIAWPTMEALEMPLATLAQMDAEHAAMAAALERAAGLMHRLPNEPTEAVRAETLTALEQLREVTVTHLDHEEELMEPIYLDEKNSAAIKAMSKKFQRRGTPADGGKFLAWVLDGCGPDERASIEGSIPKPVLAIVLGLFGRGYRKKIAPVWAA